MPLKRRQGQLTFKGMLVAAFVGTLLAALVAIVVDKPTRDQLGSEAEALGADLTQVDPQWCQDLLANHPEISRLGVEFSTIGDVPVGSEDFSSRNINIDGSSHYYEIWDDTLELKIGFSCSRREKRDNETAPDRGTTT